MRPGRQGRRAGADGRRGRDPALRRHLDRSAVRGHHAGQHPGRGQPVRSGAKQGVKRIIFASSNHAVGYYKTTDMLDASMPARADSMYGISKCFGETMSRYYYDRFGLETVCIRIGSSFPEPANKRMMTTYFSYDDLTEMLRCSLFAPRVGHTIVFGMSDNDSLWWDNRYARHLGYKAKDSSQQFAHKFPDTLGLPGKGRRHDHLPGRQIPARRADVQIRKTDGDGHAALRRPACRSLARRCGRPGSARLAARRRKPCAAAPLCARAWRAAAEHLAAGLFSAGAVVEPDRPRGLRVRRPQDHARAEPAGRAVPDPRRRLAAPLARRRALRVQRQPAARPARCCAIFVCGAAALPRSSITRCG